MKRIIDTERILIKLWLDEIDDNTLFQVKNLANLPFAFKHIALMPDAHSGYGMPIGGVMAADNVIVPNAVGVDIGCGMCAVKTDLMFNPTIHKKLKDILQDIREKVPVGFRHHNRAQDESLMPLGYKVESLEVVNSEYLSALRQLGTLGGGNHFIEIQKDKENYIWIMIHSGSRNLGKKVADHYNKLDRKGIIHAIRSKRDLDEAPSAYKNIVQVMLDQEDLVKILVELSPLAVIKG